MLDPLPDKPILVVDTVAAARRDPLAVKLREASLRLRNVSLSQNPNAMGLAADLERLGTGSVTRRMRVLVVGDSTSYQLAQGLDTVAGDRLEVQWAGGSNCGIVAAERVRWWPGAEFDRTECPSPTSLWPEVVARFRPDVVLAAASLPELADQRYEGGDGWVEPGETAYTAMHDLRMAELQALLSASGALTLVATIPPLNAVDGFGDRSLASPTRLAAWLAQIERWDRTWRSVGVLDWGTMVQDAERAAGRSLRTDVVHLDPERLVSVLGPRLSQEFFAETAALRADAGFTGCRVDPGPSARLGLARCRAL
jgi:hypothetical protein